MNLNDDYREAEERAQTQMAKASADIKKPAEIDRWIEGIEHNSKRICELADALRAHRIALAGPEVENPETSAERLLPALHQTKFNAAPNPAKLEAMTEAVAGLHITVQKLSDEYLKLERLNLVDPFF